MFIPASLSRNPAYSQDASNLTTCITFLNKINTKQFIDHILKCIYTENISYNLYTSNIKHILQQVQHKQTTIGMLTSISWPEGIKIKNYSSNQLNLQNTIFT